MLGNYIVLETQRELESKISLSLRIKGIIMFK